MDYIFASAIQNITVLFLLISYDIACQWFTNLFKHMQDWPAHLTIPPSITLTPAIPKLHEPMHTAANHHAYSLNFISGVGASDFECPERFWAAHNALGNATKTQGPGSRHDILDDHFNFWNWQKYIGMGKTLMRKYKASLAERNTQVEGHRGLTATLDTKLVAKWESMCIAWEAEGFPKTKTNPYETDSNSMCLFLLLVQSVLRAFLDLTEAEVRKELNLKEERRLLSSGISMHGTSACSFVMLGLDLEDAQ